MDSTRSPSPVTPFTGLQALEMEPPAIRARFQWARRQGHPKYLWPDVSFDQWQRAAGLVGDATRAILRDGTAHHMTLPPGITPRTAGVVAFTSGMGSLLGYWIESGRLTADPEIASLLALHLDQGRRRRESVERFAVRTIRTLRRADPAVVALKGLHTARDYFPDPGTRPLADIDLLIAEPCIAGAEHALRADGFRSTVGLRSPYRRDWLRGDGGPPKSLEIDHAENPMTLDLHGSLTRIFSGTKRVDPAPFGTSTRSWTLHGEPVRVLAQPLLTAFLALHASEELHHLRLVRLYELIQVIRRDTMIGQLGWNDLGQHLLAANILRHTYPAFALAEKLAPGTIHENLLTHGRSAASGLMRRVVDSLEPEHCLRPHRRSLAERFMWAATPGEVVRCAAYSLRPGRTNAEPLRQVLSERFFRLVRGRVSVRP